MPETPATARQWALIRSWLADLREIPALDLVWLEGSLADGRAGPYSDIDIRFAIADESFEQLWQRPLLGASRSADPWLQKGPSRLLAGLGDYLLLETSFVRALTANGLLVEAGAIPTSLAAGKELYEWEILFSRLPPDAPGFLVTSNQTPQDAWPDREPLTKAFVWERAKFLFLMMLHTPAVFHGGELHSLQMSLDMARSDLLKLMWKRIGLPYGKRAKHMSVIFPASWLSSLNGTYPENPTKISNFVSPLLRTYRLQGEHLQDLSAKAGGGFPHQRFDMHYAWLNRELSEILERHGGLLQCQPGSAPA